MLWEEQMYMAIICEREWFYKWKEKRKREKERGERWRERNSVKKVENHYKIYKILKTKTIGSNFDMKWIFRKIMQRTKWYWISLQIWSMMQCSILCENRVKVKYTELITLSYQQVHKRLCMCPIFSLFSV